MRSETAGDHLALICVRRLLKRGHGRARSKESAVVGAASGLGELAVLRLGILGVRFCAPERDVGGVAQPTCRLKFSFVVARVLAGTRAGGAACGGAAGTRARTGMGLARTS